ncbi:MAG: hypothetical protein HY904_14625 [Deltaproteobacteria bacterium]|nr:hypothetical protein [Deltaproteobacteria bacterium]
MSGDRWLRLLAGCCWVCACQVCAPATAMAQAAAEEEAVPPGPEAAEVPAPEEAPEAEEAPPPPEAAPAPGAPAPRFVVWRIKAGTGAGALAPRLERRLRREMETRLGSEMLSKAAQSGIILIRPELADCDANLPCALDVAEALNIRYVIGGEAEAALATNVTAWVVDKKHGAEVRRVSVPIEGTGEAAEVTAMARLVDALLARQPRAGAAAEAVAPSHDQSAGGGSVPWRAVAMAALGSAGVTAAGGVVAVVGGLAAFCGMAGMLLVRQTFHTRQAFFGAVGTGVTGAAFAAVAVLALLVAVPLAGVGAWLLVRGP